LVRISIQSSRRNQIGKMKATPASHLLNSFREILWHVTGAAFLSAPKPKKGKSDLLKGITRQTSIGSLLKHKDFDELNWQLTVICFEVTHNVEIPDELSHNLEITLAEFVRRVSKLPKSKDGLFQTRRIVSVLFYPATHRAIEFTASKVEKIMKKRQERVARAAKRFAAN